MHERRERRGQRLRLEMEVERIERQPVRVARQHLHEATRHMQPTREEDDRDARDRVRLGQRARPHDRSVPGAREGQEHQRLEQERVPLQGQEGPAHPHERAVRHERDQRGEPGHDAEEQRERRQLAHEHDEAHGATRCVSTCPTP